MPIEAFGNLWKRHNGFGVLRCVLSCSTLPAGQGSSDSGVCLSRSHDSRVYAARGDVASLRRAAGQANGRVHNKAVALTVAPAVNTEWVCPPAQQQYQELSHIVSLHGRQENGHSHPSQNCNTYQDPGPVPAGQQEAQAWPLQVPMSTRQPHRQEQQDQQQPPSLQHIVTVADVLEGLVSPLGSDSAHPTQIQQVMVQQQEKQQQLQLQRSHGPVLQVQVQQQEQQQQQERKQQQDQWQPQQRPKRRSDRCRYRQHVHSAAMRVSNNTSADGMAFYLLSRIQQQLKKTRQREQQQGVLHQQNMAGPVRPISAPEPRPPAIISQQSFALQCCSGKSLYTALQAIALAAQQAARLCPPQQLLLQPQMIRNAVDAAADGRHAAAAYQLQVLLVPAAAAAVGSQVQQQQQQQPHTAARQHQKPRQGQQCSGSQPDSHCHLVSMSGGAVLQAADAATAGIAGARQPQPLVCDWPAAHTQQQATRKHSGDNSRTAQSSTAHSVQSASWHVSGLLRGKWPAQLQCSSPAGALTAVKALVRAGKQLAASGMDMLVAVTLPGHNCLASGTGQATVAAHNAYSGPPVVLWAVGYAVQQAEPGLKGAAAASSLSISCHASQVEFLRVPAAEQYLRQQQQERRKHKRRLTDLQQQNSAPTASTAVPDQQHQQQRHHITCRQQQHAPYVAGADSLEGVSLIAAPHTSCSSEQHHRDEQRLLPVGAPCSPVPASHYAAKEQLQQQEQVRLLSLPGLSKPQVKYKQHLHAATTAGVVVPARNTNDQQPGQPQHLLQPQGLGCQQRIMLPV